LGCSVVRAKGASLQRRQFVQDMSRGIERHDRLSDRSCDIRFRDRTIWSAIEVCLTVASRMRGQIRWGMPQGRCTYSESYHMSSGINLVLGGLPAANERRSDRLNRLHIICSGQRSLRCRTWCSCNRRVRSMVCNTRGIRKRGDSSDRVELLAE